VRARQAVVSKGRQMSVKIDVLNIKDDFLRSTNFKVLTPVKGN
jgi:hypothetical protein